MVEQDVIAHLIDVERLAYDLLLDAQKEADTRKAAAKEYAENEYRTAYDQIITALETAFEHAKKTCDTSRNAEYDSFSMYLDQKTINTLEFNQYLDSLFFGH